MSEIGSDTPMAPSAPRPEIPKEDDPRRYIQAFLSSQEYNTGLEKFYEGKKLAPDVTEDEKRSVFEGTESGKSALLDFAQNSLMFSFNPDRFDQETSQVLKDYISTVTDFLKVFKSGTQEEILNADEYRSVVHNRAAKALADNGYVSSDKLGRTLARLVLIDKNLDTFENAGVSDLERVRRKLGAT